MAKLFFFESVVGLFYTHVFTAPKDSDIYGKPTQLAITFAARYVAGVGCAVVSHPADSVVSLIGKAEHRGKGLRQIAAETGLTFQWWIYDACKTAMCLGTTGGK
ncbi:hypothetical protein V8D89_002174 [Ganoderma adspersum]